MHDLARLLYQPKLQPGNMLSTRAIGMVGMPELGKNVRMYAPGLTSLNSKAPSTVIPVDISILPRSSVNRTFVLERPASMRTASLFRGCPLAPTSLPLTLNRGEMVKPKPLNEAP